MKNISEAFTFIFKDPDWSSKVLIGGLFTFLSIFLIGIPVVYGYNIELLQRVRRGEQYPLPEWKDPGIKFIVGLKYLATLFIYYLPLIFMLIPILFLTALSFVQCLTYTECTLTSVPVIMLLMVAVPYTFFMTLISPIISILFAEKESIRDGLRLGKVMNLFKRCWQDVLVVFALCFAIDMLASIGIILFIVGILFTSFYVSLVRFHLYGQIAISLSE